MYMCVYIYIYMLTFPSSRTVLHGLPDAAKYNNCHNVLLVAN